MPIVGYKTKMNKIKGLNCTFLINFKLTHNKYGFLENRTIDDTYFDSGDFRIKIEEMSNAFTKEVFKKYDNGLYIVSILKYIVDKLPGLYSVKVYYTDTVDEYTKEEIIDTYEMVKNTEEMLKKEQEK